ncbi:hypothetical protein GOODEAATRI_033154 [Goodea atripinnis]|uniref:Secreted protein n=1 Tax=Goodea atripinnis TaxID=208336 RepID=A0ABV0PTL8_9TELE
MQTQVHRHTAQRPARALFCSLFLLVFDVHIKANLTELTDCLGMSPPPPSIYPAPSFVSVPVPECFTGGCNILTSKSNSGLFKNPVSLSLFYNPGLPSFNEVCLYKVASLWSLVISASLSTLPVNKSHS